MKLRTAIFGTVLCGSLAVCAGAYAEYTPSTAPPSTPSSSTAAPSTMLMQQNAEKRLSSGDKEFLKNAAQAGHTEIEGSKLAQGKAARAEVQAFADQMIQDHTKLAQELEALSKDKGYTPPTEPSLAQKAKLKALDIMDDTFDQRYTNQIGVSAHEDAVELFSEAASQAEDPDIKAFAAKNLPTLRHHLDMARQLKHQVDPAK